MKTVKLIALVGMIFLASSCTSQSGKISAIETSKFAAGFGAATLVHEAGHYVVANLEGMNNVRIHPTKVTYEYDTYSKSAKRNIAMAGFGADFASTRLLMSNDEWFPKDNNFVLGYLARNMVHPVFATLRYELGFDGKYDDLRSLKETGVSPQLVEAGLIAHAALTYYQLKHNPKSPLYIEASPRKVGLNLIHRF